MSADRLHFFAPTEAPPMSANLTEARRSAEYAEALHGPYRKDDGWSRWERVFIAGFYLWATVTFLGPFAWHIAARIFGG